jgi:hypothetical protein
VIRSRVEQDKSVIQESRVEQCRTLSSVELEILEHRRSEPSSTAQHRAILHSTVQYSTI